MNSPASHSITRRSASNLALAFVLLPREKREQMSTLYAFCREVDDVADNEAVPVQERAQQLRCWREDLQAVYAGKPATLPVNQELKPVIDACRLPYEYFDELIRGVEMDLETQRYEDYPSLELYCYRVASVVGLLSIEIFRYHGSGSREYAIALGKALQFTNILRDVRTDAVKGRIYIPQCELHRFGARSEDILAGTYTEPFRLAATAMAARATEFYDQALRALPPEDRKSMVAAELMGAVYWRLLEKLRRNAFDVFGSKPIRVSKPGKIALILRSWWRLTTGSTAPNYGSSSIGRAPRS